MKLEAYKLAVSVVALVSLVAAIVSSVQGQWDKATYFLVLSFGLNYMGDQR